MSPPAGTVGPVTSLEPPSGLSPSSLDLWEQCQRRFRIEKVERRPTGGSGLDAVVGIYVHRVLEILMAEPMRRRTIDRARLLCGEVWKEIQEREDYKALGLGGQPYVGPAEEAEDQAAARLAFRRRVWASVRSYFETENPAYIDVVATEQKLGAVIEGVPIRGIVDRIERDAFDDLVVTDYKSGKVPAPMFRGPKLRQLNLYAALVEAVLDERPTDGRLVFTSFGKVIGTKFTPDTVSEAVEAAVDAWEGIGAAMAVDGPWEPSPGPLCGWCPWVGECDEGLAEIRDRRGAGKLKKAAPNYDLAAPETVAPPS